MLKHAQIAAVEWDRETIGMAKAGGNVCVPSANCLSSDSWLSLGRLNTTFYLPLLDASIFSWLRLGHGLPCPVPCNFRHSRQDMVFSILWENSLADDARNARALLIGNSARCW